MLKIEHGFAFKGKYFDPAGSRILLTPKNFNAAGGLDLTKSRCKFYEGPVERRFVLDSGDVVVAMTDLKQDAPILGSAGIVPEGERYLHNQRIGKVKIRDEDRLDRRFVPWLLNAPVVRQAVRSSATGSTVRHTAPTRIEAVTFPLPQVQTQRRIAATLSAFDELVAGNERRIELLEDLARSLYREWFVHFRFPGHGTSKFVDSDLGRIPDGWTPTVASRIFDLNPSVGGRAASYPKVTLRDVSTRFSHVMPSASASRASGARYRRGDVLMARITPSLENGKTALALFLGPDEIGMGSTELIVLRGGDVGSAFTYCAARSQPFRDHAIKSMSGASGRQRVASDCFDSLSMVRPAEDIAALFESMAMPMLEEVFQLRRQSDQLAETRDFLLPRLVTGELDISDLDLGALTPPDPA